MGIDISCDPLIVVNKQREQRNGDEVESPKGSVERRILARSCGLPRTDDMDIFTPAKDTNLHPQGS